MSAPVDIHELRKLLRGVGGMGKLWLTSMLVRTLDDLDTTRERVVRLESALAEAADGLAIAAMDGEYPAHQREMQAYEESARAVLAPTPPRSDPEG